MPALTTESSILVVGAGSWGCSTALHLARRGYKHVTVLDPYTIPSPIAAMNDINKIMEHKDVAGNMPRELPSCRIANGCELQRAQPIPAALPLQHAPRPR